MGTIVSLSSFLFLDTWNVSSYGLLWSMNRWVQISLLNLYYMLLEKCQEWNWWFIWELVFWIIPILLKTKQNKTGSGWSTRTFLGLEISRFAPWLPIWSPENYQEWPLNTNKSNPWAPVGMSYKEIKIRESRGWFKKLVSRLHVETP